MVDFKAIYASQAEKYDQTDYRFSSVDEAADLTRFFFGDELADEIVRNRVTVLPECTGVWWLTA